MDSRVKDHNPERENFYKVWQRKKNGFLRKDLR